MNQEETTRLTAKEFVEISGLSESRSKCVLRTNKIKMYKRKIKRKKLFNRKPTYEVMVYEVPMSLVEKYMEKV